MNETVELANNLRVTEWDKFVGQKRVKSALLMAIESARIRNAPMEHVLLYGPPGLGKTTLAGLIAKSMNSSIRVTSGPALERSGDLASILSGLQEGDILFVDEIHRLNKTIEEMLYPAMEDYALDVVMGKGPAARTLRLELPKFTLIGATTKIGMIASPLRDRFGVVHHLEYYEPEELAVIVNNASNVLSVELLEEAALEIAKRARLTARVALMLLRRVRDFAVVKGVQKVGKKEAIEALSMLSIDDLGLNEQDRKLLLAVIEKHDGGPVGLETLAALMNDDVGTISDVYEPFLMRLGLLKRTSRGRMVTRFAYSHLGLKTPQPQS
jgi:holliday junction DNA helicase RuvB